jgi:hypothetical protein
MHMLAFARRHRLPRRGHRRLRKIRDAHARIRQWPAADGHSGIARDTRRTCFAFANGRQCAATVRDCVRYACTCSRSPMVRRGYSEIALDTYHMRALPVKYTTFHTTVRIYQVSPTFRLPAFGGTRACCALRPLSPCGDFRLLPLAPAPLFVPPLSHLLPCFESTLPAVSCAWHTSE